MSAPVVLLVSILVREGCEGAFLEATLANARASRQEPGVMAFDVLQDDEDPRRFVLVEIYRDAEAPRLHKETAHYAAWAAAAEPLMAEPRTRRRLRLREPE